MKKTILLSIILSMLDQGTSFACTDFLVKAKDGSAVVARSMEFAISTKSNIRFFPKGDRIQSVIPESQGISCVSKTVLSTVS